MPKRMQSVTPRAEPSMTESATSPMPSPEHPDYMMRPERAEKLLNLVRRKKPGEMELSNRLKLMAVLKRKLLNQLRVPTSSNPSFHMYREVDLMTAQAAKSVFFDLRRSGPYLRGKSIYWNFETDCNLTMRRWFSLEERRVTAVGHAVMRSHGQVLVMARPPMLVEHQTHDEAEGIRLTAGMMTLNCRGIPRLAPPPLPENDSEEEAKRRQEAADKDLEVAWGLVKELAERGSCKLDRHWFFSLADRYGACWRSYLSDQEGNDSEINEENSEEEDQDS